MIARFAEATRPAPRRLPDEATRLLADLVTRRRQIVAMITAERQRDRHFTAPRLKRSAARLITALERALAELDTGIDQAVARKRLTILNAILRERRPWQNA